MPKSKLRGGAKTHRKRVIGNAIHKKQQLTAMQKLFNESMKQQMEELKKKYEEQSGTTENQE